MAGELVTTATIRAHDQLTGPLMAMAAKVRSIQTSFSGQMQRIQNAVVPMVAPGAAAFGLQQLIQNTKESATLAWEANAALLAGTLDDTALDTEAKKLEAARAKAEELRQESMRLSASMGLMPEAFQKSGAEALKMGMDYARAKAIMKASGLVNLSDREADPAVMTKALGTYDILYGQADPMKRASMLALAGAKTRTSASKLEEGLRNYAGVHGAFGGRFEDAVALIASQTQVGQFEKEAGTSLKSLQTRFLRMPAEGRAALAASGIDISKFMDFAAVDPTRATNQIIQAFPQQLAKGARGSLSKFFEKAQRDGRMNDPAIINEALAHLEKLGLKFAGDQDREAATAKLGSILHGAGGRFDPIALLTEVNKAIEEGRAGDGIWSAIGEPKRLHQYAAFKKMMKELKELRDQLIADEGKYLELVEKGRKGTDADNLSRIESAWRRFQINLVRTPAIAKFMETLSGLTEKLSNAGPMMQNAMGLGAVMLAIGGPALIAARALTAVGAASIAAMVGLGRMAALPLLGMAAGLRNFAVGLGMIGLANVGTAATGMAGLLAVLSRFAMVAVPVAAIAGLVHVLGNLDTIQAGAGFQQLTASLERLGLTAGVITEKMTALLGMNPSSSPLLSGIDMVASNIAKAVDGIDRLLRVLKGEGGLGDLQGGLNAINPNLGARASQWLMEKFGPQAPVGLSNVPVNGLPDLKLLEVGDGLKGAGVSLKEAAAELMGAAARLVAPIIVPGNGGGTAGPATAPSPTPTNGQAYGAR